MKRTLRGVAIVPAPRSTGMRARDLNANPIKQAIRQHRVAFFNDGRRCERSVVSPQHTARAGVGHLAGPL